VRRAAHSTPTNSADLRYSRRAWLLLKLFSSTLHPSAHLTIIYPFAFLPAPGAPIESGAVSNKYIGIDQRGVNILAEENNAVAGAEDTSAPVAADDTTTTDTTTDTATDGAGTNGTGSDATATEGTDTDAGSTPAAEAPAPAPSAPAPRDSRFGLADSLTSALPSLGGEDQPRKEVPGGRSYEIIYIVRTGDPTSVEASTTRVRELIEGGEGAVDNIRTSEIRRLAYPVKKQTEGIYVVINARFSKDLTEELERYFKLEEAVLRHMVLREDED